MVGNNSMDLPEEVRRQKQKQAAEARKGQNRPQVEDIENPNGLFGPPIKLDKVKNNDDIGARVTNLFGPFSETAPVLNRTRSFVGIAPNSALEDQPSRHTNSSRKDSRNRRPSSSSTRNGQHPSTSRSRGDRKRSGSGHHKSRDRDSSSSKAQKVTSKADSSVSNPKESKPPEGPVARDDSRISDIVKYYNMPTPVTAPPETPLKGDVPAVKGDRRPPPPPLVLSEKKEAKKVGTLQQKEHNLKKTSSPALTSRLSESSDSTSESEDEVPSQPAQSKPEPMDTSSSHHAAPPQEVETPQPYSFELANYLNNHKKRPASKSGGGSKDVQPLFNPGIESAFNFMIDNSGDSKDSSQEQENKENTSLLPAGAKDNSELIDPSVTMVDIKDEKFSLKIGIEMLVGIEIPKPKIQTPVKPEDLGSDCCYTNKLPAGLKIPKRKKESSDKEESGPSDKKHCRRSSSPSRRDSTDRSRDRSNRLDRKHDRKSTAKKDCYNQRRRVGNVNRNKVIDWDAPSDKVDSTAATEQASTSKKEADDGDDIAKLLRQEKERLGLSSASGPAGNPTAAESPKSTRQTKDTSTERVETFFTPTKSVLEQAVHPIATVAPVVQSTMDTINSIKSELGSQSSSTVHSNPVQTTSKAVPNQETLQQRTPNSNTDITPHSHSKNDLSCKPMDEIFALYKQRKHEARLAKAIQRSILYCESAVYFSCIEDPDEQKMRFLTNQAHTYTFECERIQRASNECEVCEKKLQILMRKLRAHLIFRLFTSSKPQYAQLRQDLTQVPQFKQALNSKTNFLQKEFFGANATPGQSTPSEDVSSRTMSSDANIMGSGLTNSSIGEPTPSPAESNASEHSTGSNESQSKRCSTTTVCFPRKVSADISKYLEFTDNLLEFHLLLENIDGYRTVFQDFFASLDHEFGYFNPRKTTTVVGSYILAGISRIHDHCPASSAGNSQ